MRLFERYIDSSGTGFVLGETQERRGEDGIVASGMTIMSNTRNTAGLETPRCALGSASRAGALVNEENAWK